MASEYAKRLQTLRRLERDLEKLKQRKKRMERERMGREAEAVEQTPRLPAGFPMGHAFPVDVAKVSADLPETLLASGIDPARVCIEFIDSNGQALATLSLQQALEARAKGDYPNATLAVIAFSE